MVLVLLAAIPSSCYGGFSLWKHSVFPEPRTVDLTSVPTEWDGVIPGNTYEVPEGFSLDANHVVASRPPLLPQFNASGTRVIVEYEPIPPIPLGKGSTFRVDGIFRYQSMTCNYRYWVVRVFDGKGYYEHVIWMNPELSRPNQ